MGWADRAKEALRHGETVTIRPRGHSMRPKVNDGDLVTLVPCVHADLVIGSIVLVRVGGNDYLHLVTAMDGQRFQIGNNRGRINGWVGPNAIYGRATRVGADDVLSNERPRATRRAQGTECQKQATSRRSGKMRWAEIMPNTRSRT